MMSVGSSGIASAIKARASSYVGGSFVFLCAGPWTGPPTSTSAQSPGMALAVALVPRIFVTSTRPSFSAACCFFLVSRSISAVPQ
jgi:hypothetical protein